MLAFFDGKRFLDIGCGSGFGRFAALRFRWAQRSISIDFDLNPSYAPTI